MLGGICIILLLGTVPCSVSVPDSLETLNINLNLGEETNIGYGSDYFGGYGGGYGYGGYGPGAEAGVGAGVGAGIPWEQNSGMTCPMERQHTSFHECRCGSETCKPFESCSKFNTSKRTNFSQFLTINGYFDKNCTTGPTCITRCKQPGKLCRMQGPMGETDGYPLSCSCEVKDIFNNTLITDVDNPAMCDKFFDKKLASCACPDGKNITQLPNGEEFEARNVWLEPARDADD